MKEPTVHFFDGQTSTAHDAQVEVSDIDVLDIRYSGKHISWLLSEEHVDWERTHDGIRVRYGDYPKMTLQVKNDKELTAELVKVLKGVGRGDVHDTLLQGVRKAPAVIAVLLLVTMVLGYLFVLPPMAEGLASSMPLSADEAFGNMVYANMVQSGLVDADPTYSDYLQDFANSMTLATEHDLKLHYVNSEQINAFALPGGHIVVFSAIIDRMETPEQLAALLAHEAAHVQERHSTRMMMRDIAGYAFISLLLGDVNGVLVVAADHADDFQSLAYGRDLEREADRQGIEDLVNNGIDPHGMVDLLELLEAEAGEMPDELEFLSSHPLTSERISDAREFASDQAGLWQVSAEMRDDFYKLKEGSSSF